MSREDYIANTAKDIFSKIPLASMDVGSYDLLQTRTLLLQKNDEDFITPCKWCFCRNSSAGTTLSRRWLSLCRT